MIKMKIKCNLCGQEFDDNDPYIQIIKTKHERFHTNCKKEKRNTVEGNVEWLL